MISGVYTSAGSPSQVMGISTNVAGWNAWSANLGEFAGASDGQYNKCQDEKRYVAAICPLITADGMPCHAITDTGRNAVQGLRLAWGDWYNVNGAGFGVRPTSDTGDDLEDASVWVKPGGESDGTSDLLLLVMIFSVGWRMRSSLLHRRGSGMSRTLRCCPRMLFQHLLNLRIYSLHL